MNVCDVYILFIKCYTTLLYISKYVYYIRGEYYTYVAMYKQIINLYSTNSKSFRHQYND